MIMRERKKIHKWKINKFLLKTSSTFLFARPFWINKKNMPKKMNNLKMKIINVKYHCSTNSKNEFDSVAQIVCNFGIPNVKRILNAATTWSKSSRNKSGEKKTNLTNKKIELNKIYTKVERVTLSKLSMLSESQLRHETHTHFTRNKKRIVQYVAKALPIHGWIHLLLLKCLAEVRV